LELDLIEILIKILTVVDGWAVVIIFALYIGFRIYKEYQSGEAVRVLKHSVEKVLDRIEISVNTLVKKVDQLIKRIE